MKYKAFLKSARISVKKARITVALIRKKSVSQAENILQFSKTKSAKLILKLLKSAVANAKNQDADIASLKISEIKVDAAPFLKRQKIRSRGRADLIRRKNSHITIVLSEAEDSSKKSKVKTKKEALPPKEARGS